MKTIVLVRHAQSETNVRHMLSTDTYRNPLTDAGVSQAKRASKELKRLPKPDYFFSSPVLRAVQTADIIAKDLRIAPVIDDRLRERGMGDLNNRAFKSRNALLRFAIGEVKKGYPNGLESWESMKRRMKGFMKGLPKGLSMAVSHKDPICAAAALVDKSYDGPLTSFKTNVQNASITIIDIENRKVVAVGRHEIPAGYSVR